MEAQQTIREATRELLPAIIADAVTYFQQAIAAKKVVASGDLINNIAYMIKEETEGLVGQINFHEYGRYRDMKSLRWAGKAPPIEELENWVKTKGIATFAWVPGYEAGGSIVSESIAIRKIASAIVHHIASVQTVKRNFTGTFYNKTVTNMVNVARGRISARVADILAKSIVYEFQNP